MSVVQDRVKDLACWNRTNDESVSEEGDHRGGAGQRVSDAVCQMLKQLLHMCRYGWMVLIVEMLGATSTILYGLNIILDPVHEPLEMDAEQPGVSKVGYNSCHIHNVDIIRT